jgi:hypothetical protein
MLHGWVVKGKRCRIQDSGFRIQGRTAFLGSIARGAGYNVEVIANSLQFSFQSGNVGLADFGGNGVVVCQARAGGTVLSYVLIRHAIKTFSGVWFKDE